MKDYYKILNVKKSSKKEDIEKSYRELKNKYNIENYKGDAKSFVEEKISDIEEAYSVLSDEYLKGQYDSKTKEAKAQQNEGVNDRASPGKFSKFVNNINDKLFKDTSEKLDEEIEREKEELKRVREENKQKSKKNKKNEDEDVFEDKGKAYEVGTIKSMTHLAKTIFEGLPRFKFDNSKESIFALLMAIGIVVLLGVILWFIPWTNGFMRNFLLIG